MHNEADTEQQERSNALRVLEIVAILVDELHAHRQRGVPVDLDSALERDLGFDSLSRVELMLRIERAFGVGLPEQLLTSAETPRDLLHAIEATDVVAEKRQAMPSHPTAAENVAAVPIKSTTLNNMLHWHVRQHAQRTHVYLYEGADTALKITYQDLLQGAQRIAAGLQAQGLSRGERVAIMLPTSRDYLYSFFAILLAGCVPVPIYPPARPSQLEDHLRRHARILDNARVSLLITVSKAHLVASLLRAQVDSLRAVVTASALGEIDSRFSPVQVKANDTALLQYTSGSTGQPKGRNSAESSNWKRKMPVSNDDSR